MHRPVGGDVDGRPLGEPRGRRKLGILGHWRAV
jgi:hypothetical protein